ncbi:MAG: hypothetical protein WC838_00885 [Candidatus Margulisiibacteriota bacterium]|jgi:hypothetical protein
MIVHEVAHKELLQLAEAGAIPKEYPAYLELTERYASIKEYQVLKDMNRDLSALYNQLGISVDRLDVKDYFQQLLQRIMDKRISFYNQKLGLNLNSTKLFPW